ncbi:hypothetical protein [Microbacterium sp. TNHR37B]|uniref:hypothetical protein n=1 Tax=Microbacterium sp. TNHR37B TaxID=1775956 RepID=UPI0012F81902|nr:hypothetical protein [Microbacterium sp. TNHR37B]
MSRSGRAAAGAVAAVAVLQIVTAVATTAIWVSHTMFAGNTCSPECEGAEAGQAGMLFFAFTVGSFVLTAVGVVVAWRKEVDLAWLPLVSSAMIVVGLLLALALFDQAMS